MKKWLIGALAISTVAYAAVNVTINGSTYSIPQKNEKGWGDSVTSWIQAASQHLLQKTGGTFTLSGEVNFGSSYGLKGPYYKSSSSNIADGGVLRLSNTDLIKWRNAANDGNVSLGVDTLNQLTLNGSPLIGGSLTASRALQSSASGVIEAASVTSTELGYSSGVTSSLCGINQSCTLTNKTLTAPVISTISNTGTLTLPTSTDTLVGRATTDTLTNKSISGATNTLSAIPDSALNTISTAGKVSNSATTATNANTASAIVARDASGNFTAGTITANLTGNVTGNLTGAVTGNASTATALAANPSDCGAGTKATAIDASGNLTCSSVDLSSDTAATALPATKGGTGQTTYASGDIIYASAANTLSKLAKGSDGLYLKLVSGLPAWAAGSSSVLSVVSKTTTYTATSTDDVILVDASGGAWTLSLPAAASNTGKVYYIKRTDNTLANAVTLDPNGAETIDGSTTRPLYTQNESVVIYSDGSNWRVADHFAQTEWITFTPSGSWTTNATYTGKYRRMGDVAQVQSRVVLSGANTQGVLTIDTPFTIDTAKLLSTTANRTQIFASGGKLIDDNGSFYPSLSVAYSNSTKVAVQLQNVAGTYGTQAGVDSSSNVPITFAANDEITIYYEIPVSGWW